MKYRGFAIHKEVTTRYQVRLYQSRVDGEMSNTESEDSITHVWNPWSDSVDEAKAVVDKLIRQSHEEGLGHEAT
jgi:hypothetical protein